MCIPVKVSLYRQDITFLDSTPVLAHSYVRYVRSSRHRKTLYDDVIVRWFRVMTSTIRVNLLRRTRDFSIHKKLNMHASIMHMSSSKQQIAIMIHLESLTLFLIHARGRSKVTRLC